MSNGTIYIIKNQINDKVYIGQTIQTPIRRWQAHLSDSKDKNTHLYRAMRSYGVENFYMEILEDGIPTSQLSDREIYYINKYNSYYEGYNSTLGGETGAPGTPVYQYDLQGNFIRGYLNANDAERSTGCLHQNILKTCKSVFSQTGGFYWSFQKKEKINIPQNTKYKPVGKLDENNNLVKQYRSIKELAEELKIPATNVSRAIRKGYRLHGDYYVYLEESKKNVNNA